MGTDLSGLLSEREQEALELTKQLANLMWAIIKAPRMIVQSDEGEDWRYATDHIHALQHMIMSQAAARAYPGKYRPLGGGRLDG